MPLLTGRPFVVFVSCDAGNGCLVAVTNSPEIEKTTKFDLITPAEGPEFTEEHPRLHYGWQTTKEYRTRFGYLDYMCRTSPEGQYMRDAGKPPQLPAEIEERCSFVLYPYVSGTFIQAIRWHVHEDALKRLREDFVHPAREEVLELAKFSEEQGLISSAFTKSELELSLQQERNDGAEPSADLPPR